MPASSSGARAAGCGWRAATAAAAGRPSRGRRGTPWRGASRRRSSAATDTATRAILSHLLHAFGLCHAASPPEVAVVLARDLVVVAIEDLSDTIGLVLAGELDDCSPSMPVHTATLYGGLCAIAEGLYGLALDRLPIHTRPQVLNEDPSLRRHPVRQ